MKTNLPSFLKIPRIAMAVLLGLTALPTVADAKPKDKDKGKGQRYSRSTGDRDRARHHYDSIPRSRFSLTLGMGYAGRGYYYGPAGVPYFYERPEVRYYRSRSHVPQSYFGGSHYSSGSTAVAVQRELYRRGYYYGPIDGDIGAGSRRAIARYQAAHRLPVTGTIDRPLLYSLGLA